MRMAADHLLRHTIDHIREREGAFLLGHTRVIDDLEQQIAELLLEIDPVAALDRVGDLVGFLDRVGRDGRECLLEVPRTACAGRSERGHDGKEIGNGFANAGLVGRSHHRFLDGALHALDDICPLFGNDRRRRGNGR